MTDDREISEALEWMKRFSAAIELMTSHVQKQESNPLVCRSPQLKQPSNATVARRRLASRRLRDRFFGQGLFADPAWDMMLDLYAAHYKGKSISVSSLTIAASVPASTALRWIVKMVEEKFMQRHPDPLDGRKVYISLTPDVIKKLDEYFVAVREIDQRLNP